MTASAPLLFHEVEIKDQNVSKDIRYEQNTLAINMNVEGMQ